MGKYNPEIHHRRSIRLKGFDYSQEGYYFITITTKGRENFFGEIVNGEMILNDAGKMIDYQWNNLAIRFTHIKLDKYVVMPNHLHGIINVGATLAVDQNKNINIRAGTRPAPTRPAPTRPAPTRPAPTRPAPTGSAPTITIGSIVGAFKSITTLEYLNGIKNKYKPFDGKLWQRNYYEQIIRNQTSLLRIREYINNNPIRWMQDELNWA